jgi:alpha-L-arabinofuranosidase
MAPARGTRQTGIADRQRRRGALLAQIAVLSVSVAAAQDATAPAGPTASITVRADKLGNKISPTLYGIFYEEINHAGDGGLYAELIQNRSFDETLPVEGCTLQGNKCVAVPSACYFTGKTNNWSVAWTYATPWPAWSLEKSASVDAAISIQTDRPLHPANPTFLRLQVATLPDAGAVRLLNEGYWGIGIRDGEQYEFSFFARSQNPPITKVGMGVVSADGRVLAVEQINLKAGDWTKYAGTLTAKGADAHAKFFLQPLSAGSLDVDFVSLFPRQTFKNRPNGCRAALAQLLAVLKPGVVRFPGGCVVEGVTMENRVQWKKTIGPVHTRPGHWSLWGYRTADGLGFYEFLQLCEDIGAQGMWVINCGMSCLGQNGDYWPDARLPELIQDTLDGIEYALGSPDSKWGRRRAEAGHPAPFPLKYIEIGNENFGPIYQARYRLFAAAIKQAWPQLTLICNEKLDGIEMEDPHFYVAPQFFFENHRHFDTAPRENAPRIYVGEFAVNRSVGSGNLLAALAEAAFMMGLERNSDLVTMCSYAPLFFNVHNIQWPVNMIGFDSAGSFGRSSYYAQKMFAGNLADVNLACEATAPTMTLESRTGRIALGTWNTQAEFKDVKVTDPTGQTLLAADFSQGLGQFKTVSGEWSVVDGALRQNGSAEGARALAGSPQWRDYTFSVKARKLSGHEGFLIMFDAAEHNKNWWNLGGWGNREHGLEVGGVEPARVPGSIETGRWYDIRIELAGTRIRCFLDGRLIHDVERQTRLSSLYAVAGRKHDTGEIILKVVNAADKPQATRICLKGIPSPAARATLLTLSHPDRTAENSIAEPAKIVPTETTVNVSADFTHTFPANSINVLRVKPARP